MFSRNVQPGMFGLDIVLKDNFIAYSTQFVFLAIGNVPRNVAMVTIDMCGKSSIKGEWIYGVTWKHAYFNISVIFIVHTTSILKLVSPITYCFCLVSHLSGCVAVIINVAVAFLLCYCNRYSYFFHDCYSQCYFCYACHALL